MVEIPDQTLFEPEPTRESPRWRRWFLGVGVVLAIAGLLYFSGFYQLSFFHRTSSSFVRSPMAQIVDGENITLPLSIVVLADGAAGSAWREEDVARLVSNTEAIWSQAGISFVVESIGRREVTHEDIQQFLREPETITNQVYGSRVGITVVLLASLQGLNGIAYTGRELVAVADYTTSFNDRVLGHEIGHILGLKHVVGEPGRLMAQGSEGVGLTFEEVVRARNSASSHL